MSVIACFRQLWTQMTRCNLEKCERSPSACRLHCRRGMLMATLCLRFYLLAVLWSLSSHCSAQITELQTIVTPLANEDIASPCHYWLKISTASHTIRATWVVFDRGLDVHNLYSDPAMLAFCRRFRIALLLHGHCPGKLPEDHHDMNMDPAKGLGPALFRALSCLLSCPNKLRGLSHFQRQFDLLNHLTLTIAPGALQFSVDATGIRRGRGD
jgi:hypothetical protein